MPDYAASFSDVRAAAERLRAWVHRTPIATCATLDRLAGRQLFFKCEHLQKIGAFKFRGAMNAMLQLPEEAAARGVVTHSSGNHAQALALAARLRGVEATIVMPANSAAVKRRAVVDYGARVVDCAPNLAARESTTSEIQSQTGATLVPPYDHPHIIAGQGTAALELLEQVPDLDAVIAPVGGGGLMAGTCIAIRGLAPQVNLFAGEPLGADDAARSFAGKEFVPQTDPRTIADGLRTSLGELTWPILRDHLAGVITATEEEIIAAMRLAWERAKLMIEPSSAVPIAAVLGEQFRQWPELRRVGIILSGGNVDLAQLPFK